MQVRNSESYQSLRLQSDFRWGYSHLMACLGVADPLPRFFNKIAKLVPRLVGCSAVLTAVGWSQREQCKRTRKKQLL